MKFALRYMDHQKLASTNWKSRRIRKQKPNYYPLPRFKAKAR